MIRGTIHAVGGMDELDWSSLCGHTVAALYIFCFVYSILKFCIFKAWLLWVTGVCHIRFTLPLFGVTGRLGQADSQDSDAVVVWLFFAILKMASEYNNNAVLMYVHTGCGLVCEVTFDHARPLVACHCIGNEYQHWQRLHKTTYIWKENKYINI